MGQVLRFQKEDEPVPTPRVGPADLRDRILELLPATREELAAQTGRPANDGTLRTRLQDLATEGVITCHEGQWRRAPRDTDEAVELTRPPLPEGFERYEFPSDFDQQSRDLFSIKLDEHEIETSTEIETLEAYVGALQRARIARAAAQKTPFGFSHRTGRHFAHPGLAVAREAERDAGAFRKELRDIDARKRGGDPDGDPTLFS